MVSDGSADLPERLATATATLSIDDDTAAAHLARLDGFATANVRAGTGGPFAAELFIHNRSTGDLISLSGPMGNAVLSKGIASAHAEAETLTEATLEKALTILKDNPDDDLQLLQVSSAESCPACRSKQIAFLHRLKAEGWPQDARIEVVFAATYEDTFRVAGFNDKPYQDDLLGQLRPPMIVQRSMVFADLPELVRQTAGHVGAFAGCLMPDPSQAGSTWFEPVVVPVRGLSMEVAALHKASAAGMAAGIDKPWHLGAEGPAMLYTTADHVGPLMLTDSQWAGISEIIQISDRPSTPAESPLIDNAPLLARARLAYNAHGSELIVHHLSVGTHGLNNTAQQVWRDEVMQSTPEKLYNGVD